MTRPAIAMALLAALLAGPAARGVQIPADRRVPGRVETTLAAPAGSEMRMPTDVAVDGAGRVFVADGVNRRIALFGADGALVSFILRVGEVALVRPIGLAVDGEGRLWIADADLHRLIVARVAPDGTAALAREVEVPSAPGAEGVVPAQPTDVAFSPDGSRLYVVDNENHRVISMATETGEVQILGGPGRGIGRFEWPFTISVAADGYLYVCEAIGARVQRFNPALRPAGQLGRWGIELGQLYRPKGVAVGPDGRVYVSDSTLGVVQVFEAVGPVVGVLTDEVGQPLRFSHPMGLTFGPQGRLYVVELAANRVAVVQMRRPAATQPAAGRASP